MAEDNKPNKPAPGTKGIATLIEVMEANNKSTAKIAIDGQNTRRHLLEMKNMQKVMNDFQARTVYGFENFQDIIDSQKLQGMEDNRERMSIFEEIRNELRQLPKDTAAANAAAEKSSPSGNFMGKLGGLLQGAGIGVGAMGIGIAAVFATAPKLIDTFETMDVPAIKKNIMDLIGINKEVEKEGGNLLIDGGSLALAMTGIGIGLAALGIGAGVSGAVDKFLDEGWTDRIKENVLSLLSIESAVEAQGQSLLGGSSKLGIALSALGIGLAAFGIGKAAGGVGDAITEFTQGSNFADDIKKEVETLLSINLVPKTDPEKAGFVGTMAALSAGLIAFAVGKAGSGIADAITTFSGGNNFAQDIKDEVETLLTIPNLPGAGLGEGGLANFIGTMTALGLGLAAFSVGKGAAGVADAFTKFTSGDNFADDIKAEVETLLTIGEGADIEKSKAVKTSLTNLGLGLAAFAGGKGLNAFADLASGVISFFTGTKNPVDQALELGKNAADVQAGADAFDDFAMALGKFSNVNVDFNAQKFAEDLQSATKILELAIVGGSTGGFLGIGNTEFVGIANIKDDIDGAVESIERLQGALNMTSGGVTMSAPGPIEGMMVQNLSAENAILRIPQTDGAGNTNIVQQGGDNIRGGDTILIQQNQSTLSNSLQDDR
jgi:hypothetical protein